MTAIGDRSSGYTVGGLGQTAHSYGYDDLNRLVSGSASGGEFPSFNASWGYNAIGNMMRKEGAAQGFAPSGANSIRPHAVIMTSNPQQANFGYDSNGNITTRMDLGVTYTHTWDALNRLDKATEQVEAAQVGMDKPIAIQEVVADKGYHSNQTVIDLQTAGIRSCVSLPDRGRRDWFAAPDAQAPVYANRRRIRGGHGEAFWFTQAASILGS